LLIGVGAVALIAVVLVVVMMNRGDTTVPPADTGAPKVADAGAPKTDGQPPSNPGEAGAGTTNPTDAATTGTDSAKEDADAKAAAAKAAKAAKDAAAADSAKHVKPFDAKTLPDIAFPDDTPPEIRKAVMDDAEIAAGDGTLVRVFGSLPLVAVLEHYAALLVLAVILHSHTVSPCCQYCELLHILHAMGCPPHSIAVCKITCLTIRHYLRLVPLAV
jgi:hypothetical protein